jgi:hypothetical protein
MEWDILNAIKAGLTILFTWILLSSLSACGLAIDGQGFHVGTNGYFELMKERELNEQKNLKGNKNGRF